MAVSVRKVETKHDFETFLTFPWTLYKDDPRWVPPLVSMQRHKLDKAHNSSWQHMAGDYFIAWRDGQPVGTIAAFINHRHNEFHDENIGFFGLFEVVDDAEAARALLDTAADTVRAMGCDAIRGPASFSTNEETGILVENFDDPPVVLMPYNYPYYPRLLEDAPGFEKVMEFYSYHITVEGAEQAAQKFKKLFHVVERNNQRRKIVARPLDPSNMDAEFAMFKNIYNKAWEYNWGFVPFSDQELDELVADLGKFVDPRLAFFATVEDKPVAFLLGIPDMNQVLHRVYPRPGKPEVLSLLQILWHWKLRPKITRVRIMLMGIEKGYRNIGVEAALFTELYKAAGHLARLDYADGGWVLETNKDIQRTVEAFNARVYKRYRMYERKLDHAE